MKISSLSPILAEDSTTLPLFKGLPGAEALVKTLHKKYQLDPKQDWRPISKLNWSEIKDSQGRSRWSRSNFHGNWVILSFKEGAAAIEFNDGTYTAVTSTPDGKVESENFSSSRGVLNFIKENLGMKKLAASKAKMYMGSVKQSAKAPATGYRTDLTLEPVGYKNWQEKLRKAQADNTRVPAGGTPRAELKPMTGQQLNQYRGQRQKERQAIEQSSPEKILQRFKPLWLRAAQSALADINGIVQTMAKSGAYDRLKQKIDRNIGPLQSAIEKLETGQNLADRWGGGGAQSYFNNAIKRAVGLASVYYYPEETGNVNSQGTPDNPLGKQKLMSEVESGDMKKLKTILDFFKQELMRAGH